MIAARGNAFHQRVPGRMKLDRIDALALDIEALQHRGIAIGESTVLEVPGAADRGAIGSQLLQMVLPHLRAVLPPASAWSLVNRL